MEPVPALARLIDHTLLKPDATAGDVEALCAQAVQLGVFAVCVSPNLVAVAAQCAPDGLAVASVCGFPSGAHRAEAKAFEAARAVRDGADEVDMVVDLGLLRAGQFEAVAAEVAAVVSAGAGALVKVIIESAALDPEQIVAACRAAVDGGAGFVKTSTGFHPAGGASVEEVRLMRSAVGPDIGVKASGGIRTAEQALAMVAAGATRLGCSATEAILGGAAASGSPGY
jgi:deoxyribose-phosphate aldolase